MNTYGILFASETNQLSYFGIMKLVMMLCQLEIVRNKVFSLRNIVILPYNANTINQLIVFSQEKQDIAIKYVTCYLSEIQTPLECG